MTVLIKTTHLLVKDELYAVYENYLPKPCLAMFLEERSVSASANG